MKPPLTLPERFGYYRPQSEEVAAKFPTIRGACLELAELIDETVEDGREKALALTKLEEVMFWANASIARWEGDLIPDSPTNPSSKSWDRRDGA